MLTFSISPKNGFSGMIYDSENTLCIHHFNSAWLKPGLGRKLKKTDAFCPYQNIWEKII